MKNISGWVAFLAALLALGYLLWFGAIKTDSPLSEGFAITGECTTEAKMCPDGSSVGRTEANCEFAACPSAAAKKPSTKPTTSSPAAVPVGSSKSGIARYAEKITVMGVSLTPLLVVSDGRCPSDASCATPGLIKVQTRIVSGATTTDMFFEIGKPIVDGDSLLYGGAWRAYG